MFFRYLWNEIRRRRKQTLVVATGLALGIALVVTVSAMAAGVGDAQATVLSSLYGVGTDITVSQTADTDGDAGQPFQVAGDDERFSRDRIVVSPGQETFSASRVERVARLDDVAAVAGSLSLTSLRLEGELPSFVDPNAAPGDVAAAPEEASFQVSTVSLLGVDVTAGDVGPLSPEQIVRGRAFRDSDSEAKVAVVDGAYAADQGLEVGDDVEVGGTSFEVVGVATGPGGGEGSDVYLPLERAQRLAGVGAEVSTISVRATSSDSIDAVQAAIEGVLPDATVTSADDLASQVSGSLSSASSLISSLGTWLSIAVIAAAVVSASVLTLSAVGRRTRELGTLKALGWRTRRVVGQVMGETLVQGVIGGVLGVALGLLGAAAVVWFAPELTATVSLMGSAAAQVPPGALEQVIGGDDPLTQTVRVALQAPVSAQLAAAAIGLALLGGAVAGIAGGWRAARLRPADSMRQLV